MLGLFLIQALAPTFTDARYAVDGEGRGEGARTGGGEAGIGFLRLAAKLPNLPFKGSIQRLAVLCRDNGSGLYPFYGGFGLLTRRQFVLAGGALGLGGAGFSGYAFGIEPYRFLTKSYRIQSTRWPRRLTLRIAVLADLHICEPWMPLRQLQSIVANTNAVGADLIVLLGDFVNCNEVTSQALDGAEWGRVLGQLRAPLGVHAILGNHDWWEDPLVQRRRGGIPSVRRVLESVGVPVYQNDVMRLKKDGQSFWLCGLGDQWAFYGDRDEILRPATFGYAGVDDLDGTLAQLTDDAPAIMMVHEPDVFARMPERVALTLAGHTHGGQVRLLGYPPIVPSRYGYAYGHVREGRRDLIVSGGLGCSVLPVRFGCPPEIVVVDLEA